MLISHASAAISFLKAVQLAYTADLTFLFALLKAHGTVPAGCCRGGLAALVDVSLAGFERAPPSSTGSCWYATWVPRMLR